MADATEGILRALNVLRIIINDQPSYGVNNNPGLVFDNTGNLQGVQDKAGNLQGFGAASVADATAGVKGKLQLAGALGGTAASPTAFGFADLSALNTALNAAYAQLDNIKTVGGSSIIGVGDIPVSGGNSTPTPIIYATTIPLNVVDPGAVMTTDGLAPAGANERNVITTNTVLVPGARVFSGLCQVLVYTNGTNTVDVSAFRPVSGASLLESGVLTGTANHLYVLTFASVASAPARPVVGINDLGVIDLTLPTIASVVVANGTPLVLNCTTSEAIKSTMPTTMTFAVDAGHPLTGIPVYVDADHFNLVTSTPFVNGESARTLSMTVAPTNPIQDLADNVLAAFNSGLGTAVTITNNVMGANLVETFIKPDSATTLNPASDGGPNWVIWRGSAFGIDTNQGYCTSPSVDSIAVRNTGNVDSTQSMQGVIGADYPVVIFRGADSSNYLYIVIHANPGGADVSLQKHLGGVDTVLIASIDAGFVSGDTVEFQPIVSGDSVQIWVAVGAGAFTHLTDLDYTITDSALLTGTYFGIESTGNGNITRWTRMA